MSWTQLQTRAKGRRYTGLTIWFRVPKWRGTKAQACITQEVAEWLGGDRVAVHLDRERRLFALTPSSDQADGKIRVYPKHQIYIACTELAAAMPEIIGKHFTLKPANEPGIGRCLICHVPPPAEAAPQPKATPDSLHQARQAIKAMVLLAVQAGKPVNTDNARALGKAGGLTVAEVNACITRALDEARSN